VAYGDRLAYLSNRLGTVTVAFELRRPAPAAQRHTQTVHGAKGRRRSNRSPTVPPNGVGRVVARPCYAGRSHGPEGFVPYADAGPLSAKLVKSATLKTYKGFPHGMCTTKADTINRDLLAFIRG
jgi:hypothetical protein